MGAAVYNQQKVLRLDAGIPGIRDMIGFMSDTKKTKRRRKLENEGENKRKTKWTNRNITKTKTKRSDAWADCTFVQQFELVCGASVLGTVANSMVFAGWPVGALLGGFLSDRWGRHPVLIVSMWLTAVFGTISASPPVYWFFVLCRFLVGIGVGKSLIHSSIRPSIRPSSHPYHCPSIHPSTPQSAHIHPSIPLIYPLINLSIHQPTIHPFITIPSTLSCGRPLARAFSSREPQAEI